MNVTRLRRSAGVIVSLLLAAMLAAVTDAVFGSGWLRPWDATVAAWAQSLRSPERTRAMVLATSLGDPRLLVVASIGLGATLLAFARWREFALAAAVLAGGSALHVMFKAAIQRPRPGEGWLAMAQGFSFPSGHTVGAVLFYGLLAYLGAGIAARTRGRRHLYIACIALGLVIPLMVGVSRIYLGVHYASDVLAGWIAGALWLSVCVTAAAWFRARSRHE